MTDVTLPATALNGCTLDFCGCTPTDYTADVALMVHDSHGAKLLDLPNPEWGAYDNCHVCRGEKFCYAAKIGNDKALIIPCPQCCADRFDQWLTEGDKPLSSQPAEPQTRPSPPVVLFVQPRHLWRLVTVGFDCHVCRMTGTYRFLDANTGRCHEFACPVCNPGQYLVDVCYFDLKWRQK